MIKKTHQNWNCGIQVIYGCSLYTVIRYVNWILNCSHVRKSFLFFLCNFHRLQEMSEETLKCHLISAYKLQLNLYLNRVTVQVNPYKENMQKNFKGIYGIMRNFYFLELCGYLPTFAVVLKLLRINIK